MTNNRTMTLATSELPHYSATTRIPQKDAVAYCTPQRLAPPLRLLLDLYIDIMDTIMLDLDLLFP